MSNEEFEKARDLEAKKNDIGIAETTLWAASFQEGADWAREYTLAQQYAREAVLILEINKYKDLWSRAEAELSKVKGLKKK